MTTLHLASASLAFSIVLGWGAQTVCAEDAPKDNVKFTASKTTVVELGPEIEGMAGRQLRMRMLTIEPGGHIGLHSHKNRPAVVYFMQGTDEIGLADGSKAIKHPGDMSMATSKTAHYHRNIGKDNVVLIAVDIFTPAKNSDVARIERSKAPDRSSRGLPRLLHRPVLLGAERFSIASFRV